MRGSTSGRADELWAPNGEQLVQNRRLPSTRIWPLMNMRDGIVAPHAAQTFTEQRSARPCVPILLLGEDSNLRPIGYMNPQISLGHGLSLHHDQFGFRCRVHSL